MVITVLNNQSDFKETAILVKTALILLEENRKGAFDLLTLLMLSKGCREVLPEFLPCSGSHKLIFMPDTKGPHRMS